MAEPITNRAARVVGPMLGYYSDLASGYLRPDNARIESLQFRARIDPAGTITFSTPAVQIVSDYSFVLRRIVGFALGGLDVLGNAPALIDFNFVEQGRSFSVFKRNVSFAALIENPMEWDGCYVCVPGTAFDVTWAVDTTRWASLVGTSREVGVQLLGDLVSVKAPGGQ